MHNPLTPTCVLLFDVNETLLDFESLKKVVVDVLLALRQLKTRAIRLAVLTNSSQEVVEA